MKTKSDYIDQSNNVSHTITPDIIGIDDLSCSDDATDLSQQKKYFCQRCLNHDLEFQRKGHKNNCRYATCNCNSCKMVEMRRQINSILSKKQYENAAKQPKIHAKAVTKIRDPTCARCSAHGDFQKLRGHKKSNCKYNGCECHLCSLVEERRKLMARQIKLRRNQKKSKAEENVAIGCPEDLPNASSEKTGSRRENIIKTVHKKFNFADLPRLVEEENDIANQKSIQDSADVLTKINSPVNAKKPAKTKEVETTNNFVLKQPINVLHTYKIPSLSPITTNSTNQNMAGCMLFYPTHPMPINYSRMVDFVNISNPYLINNRTFLSPPCEFTNSPNRRIDGAPLLSPFRAIHQFNPLLNYQSHNSILHHNLLKFNIPTHAQQLSANPNMPFSMIKAIVPQTKLSKIPPVSSPPTL
uniref:DM domain-containing protein n=1 Tax=Rhabditophanes sp. KR3021 TaxID=114890 RepID=A0AC35U7A2_9BILA